MFELTLCFGTFQAFPRPVLIASSLVPKVRLFSAYVTLFKVKTMHREIGN